MKHEPVLLKKVVDLLRPVSERGLVVDATVGLGGHAEAILERYGEASLLGIDRDAIALEKARQRLERFGDRVRLVEGRHEQLIEILDATGVGGIDGLLADLGVSSMQLEDAERGFSFRLDGPLDMRMGSGGRTAFDVVNRYGEDELSDILRSWGEEPMAKKIARAIVEARRSGAIETTRQLATIVRSVKRPGRERIDPATLTFQAIRIAVNDEIVGLERFVNDAAGRLVSGGRLAIISFHSLEDRIVKRALRRLEGECRCPPGLPVCACGAERIVDILARRPIEADDAEVVGNPRARSAKLRAAEKR